METSEIGKYAFIQRGFRLHGEPQPTYLTDGGQGPETTSQVGRIKLVNPPAEALVRGDDGLFRTADGTDAAPDASVRVATGVLESSNVNVADAMVNMIELSRHFDLQVKAMRTAEENAAASAQLLKG